jgi:hypothetical protein
VKVEYKNQHPSPAFQIPGIVCDYKKEVVKVFESFTKIDTTSSSLYYMDLQDVVSFSVTDDKVSLIFPVPAEPSKFVEYPIEVTLAREVFKHLASSRQIASRDT